MSVGLRSGRRRAVHRSTNGRDAADPPGQIPVVWEDLDEDARAALKRLNRGHRAGLPQETGARLIALGLAVLRSDGIGISRLGRELVIARLLETPGERGG